MAKQKAEFKIGDTVKAHSEFYPELRGRTGSVVAYNKYVAVEVDFPGWKGGHVGSAEDGRAMSRWFFYPDDCGEFSTIVPAASKKRPSIADDISLKPQTKTVLRHLLKRKSISPMESLNTYGIYRLSAAIHDLRAAGYNIETNKKIDEAGHQYARYVYRKAA